MHRLLPLGGLALALMLVAWRLATLLRYDLWYDELYSLYAASGDLAGVWQAAVADRVHPPLFYLLLKAWLAVAPVDPFSLRLLPLLIWCGALLAAWQLGAAARLAPPARLIALAAVGLNPIAFDAGADLRGYALFLLFATGLLASTIHACREDEPHRSPLPVLLFAIGATWTHYFAWPLVAISIASLLHARRSRTAVTLMVGVTLAAVPWVIAIATDTAPRALQTALQWNTGPTPRDLLLFPGALLASRTPILVLGLAALAGWGGAVALRRDLQARALLAWAAAGPLAAACTSLVGLGSWDGRYFIGSIPALAVLLGRAWQDGPRHRLLVASALLAAAYGSSRPADWRLPWKTITQEIAARTPGATVFAFDGFTALPLRYYALTADAPLRVPEVKQIPAAPTDPSWIIFRYRRPGEDSAFAGRIRSAGDSITASLRYGTGPDYLALWRVVPAR
jgi:hypothetical protein